MTSFAERAALWIFRLLARAFPSQFEQLFGSEMVAAAGDLIRHEVASAQTHPWVVFATVVPRLLWDLATRLVVEQFRDLFRDLRHASRLLARSPGFTLAATGCLAIGCGVTSAMYNQVNGTIFRDVPGVTDPAALVRLQRPVSFPNFRDLAANRTGQFSIAAAYQGPVPFKVGSRGSRAERIWGHIASPNYFEALGTKAAVGRLFTENSDGVVISHRLWKSRFAGDPSIAGLAIEINGQPAMIRGVTEAGFVGASPTTAAADLWVSTGAPAAMAPELGAIEDRRATNFQMIGRLMPGIVPGQAEQALESAARNLEQVHNLPGQESKERRILFLPGGRMFPVRDQDLPKAIGFPVLLCTLVLLMACGNVANMILARNLARTREVAVRVSLGAGPGRILRQLFAESLVLSVLGAIGGTAFALWFHSLSGSMKPILPAYAEFTTPFQWQSVAFTLLIAAGSAFVFGAAPALRASRTDVYTGLKSRSAGSSGASTGRSWLSLRNVLVFQQVTVSMVLLLLTSFIVLGFRRGASVDVGFRASNLYLMSLDPVRDGYSPARTAEFFRGLPSKLLEVQGVAAVSIAQSLPLAMSSGEALIGAKVEFAGGATSALGSMRVERVGEGFFRTLGVAVRAGREFTRRDEETATARPLIVNETMAKLAWPDIAAGPAGVVGRVIDFEESKWEVVGVVSDIRSAFPLAPPAPAVFRPITDAGYATPGRQGVSVVVRTVPGVPDVPGLMRRAMDAIGPDLTVFEVKSAEDDSAEMHYLTDFATYVYGGMGLFGLVLATLGLAGVTAFAVARRSHEIGIRMALGATPAGVLSLILREGAVIVAAGTVVGLAVALAAARALASFVESMGKSTETSLGDPLLLAGIPVLLATVAMLACLLPARRAMRIDPVAALRSEQ